MSAHHPPSEKELFESALDFDSIEERQAFLEKACEGDLSRIERINGLLAACDVPEGFLPELGEESGMAPEHREEEDDAVTEKPGMTIDRFRLGEEVGDGGFGIVYRAQQIKPISREVALKVLKPGMDSRAIITRFKAERQALALMDHPNIAQVYDAGTTPKGRPYFVIEFVEGVPITTYCRDAALPLEERLNLFIAVCRAVQHAHQKGIIHRDLKSSNVMVIKQDGKAVPKVIDFGIAKATAQPLTEQTLVTQLHQFLGTPAYMSPEQATAGREDIDTRSDIYSLGALLYEILTGAPPFESKHLLSAGLDHENKNQSVKR